MSDELKEVLVEALEKADAAIAMEWLYQTGQTVRPQANYPPQGTVCGELGAVVGCIKAALAKARRERQA